MRIAIVSPYSWTYPGGVNRHVEATAGELIKRGHEVRVLAPCDPDDRLARLTHRTAPSDRELPEYLIPLGRTVANGANGAVSNLNWFSKSVAIMRRELRAFDPDVVHVHEPLGPMVSWDACSYPHAPVVGTFHAYSTNRFTNGLGVARRSPPQVQPAARPDRRLRGGRLDRPPLLRRRVRGDPERGRPRSRRRAGRRRPRTSCACCSSAAPEERKGLPVLLSAFEALVEHVPSQLVVVGAEPEDVARFTADPDAERRIDALGRVSGVGAVAPPARGRRALRAVARRRELRDDPDRGVRRGDAGDRLQHRRLRRRRRPTASTASWCRRPTPQRLAEELQTDAPRARAPRGDGRRRAPAAPSASPGRASPSRLERVYARVDGARARAPRCDRARSRAAPASSRSTARSGRRRSGCRGSIPSPPGPPPAATGPLAASALGVAGVARPRADRARRATASGSTRSSPTSSAPTRPGSWRRRR